MNVDELVGAHPYFAGRHHLRTGPELLADDRAAERERLGAAAQVVVLGGGEDLAAVGWWPSAFETEVLGVPTTKAGTLLTAPGAARVQRTEALCREVLRRGGPGLTILRVDADDTAALAGAQEAGFKVYEAASSWLAQPQPDVPEQHVEGCRIEWMSTPDALAAVPPDALGEILDEVGPAFDHHHYHSDPRLDRGRCDHLYRTWTRNVFHGGLCEQGVVVWQDGVVVGFLAMSGHDLRGGDRPARLLTRSFGMALRRAPRGVGTAMFHTAVARSSCDLLDLSTQVRNPLMRMFGRSGLFSGFSIHYTLHGWSP